MTLTTQWTTFALMIGSGFLIGTILDVYRVLKVRFHLKGWVVSLIDLLYWVVCAGLVFSLLFWSNWGDFRFYIFLAILVGLGSYLQWCSQKVSRTITFIIQGIERTLHGIYRLVYHFVWMPIVHIGTGLMRIGQVLMGVVLSILLFLWRPFRWAFQPVQRVIVSRVQKHFSWVAQLKKWWTNKKKEDDE